MALALSAFGIAAQTRPHAVVADSATHEPLPNASVFDRYGNVAGMCNSKGTMPYVSPSSYPIVVRYLGYKERMVSHADADTIFMQEAPTLLPEMVFESREKKALHMLAYIREYSTLSTYTDTVFLFREKMADYMLPPDKMSKYRGWSSPRMLKSKSYYRFTNSMGLDSVSDASGYHFSWSDWVGVNRTEPIPAALLAGPCGSDTLRGKYSPTEVWTKTNDRVSVSVDVLADTASRKWVPRLTGFFERQLDFEHFKIQFNYDNVVDAHVSPKELAGYSYNIESRGRAREMFKFNRPYEPYFVTTYAEIYLIDKEYISIKEAKQWENHKFYANVDAIQIIEPDEAPELQPSIKQLVARVNSIDHDKVRLDYVPDPRIGYRSKNAGRNATIGHRALSLLKQLTGITSYKENKRRKADWKKFTDDAKADNLKRHQTQP